MNGSLWTISYEFWCYIGVMVLGLLRLVEHRRFLLVLFVFSVLVHFVFESYGLRPGGKILGVIFGSPREWARLLPCYLSGIVLFRYRTALQFTSWGVALAVLGLLAATQVPHGLTVAVPTCGAYLLIWVSYTSVIRLRWHAEWGDFSYGIYLYAFPIQQLVMYYIGDRFTPTPPMVLFAASIVPTVLAGIASWFAVERRFLQPRVAG